MEEDQYDEGALHRVPTQQEFDERIELRNGSKKIKRRHSWRRMESSGFLRNIADGERSSSSRNLIIPKKADLRLSVSSTSSLSSRESDDSTSTSSANISPSISMDYPRKAATTTASTTNAMPTTATTTTQSAQPQNPESTISIIVENSLPLSTNIKEQHNNNINNDINTLKSQQTDSYETIQKSNNNTVPENITNSESRTSRTNSSLRLAQIMLDEGHGDEDVVAVQQQQQITKAPNDNKPKRFSLNARLSHSLPSDFSTSSANGAIDSNNNDDNDNDNHHDHDQVDKSAVCETVTSETSFNKKGRTKSGAEYYLSPARTRRLNQQKHKQSGLKLDLTATLTVPKVKGNISPTDCPRDLSDREITISVFEYSKLRLERYDVQHYSEIKEEAADWATVRWINFEGFNSKMMKHLESTFKLHPLAVEDVFHLDHRAKIELYPYHLFIIFQILQMKHGACDREQVYFIIQGNTLLTIQEGKDGDCWDEIREMLEVKSKLRREDVEFLVYSLLDTLVDQLNPVMGVYGDALEEGELAFLEDPTDLKKITVIRKLNRDLLFLRKILKPMHQVIVSMIKPSEHVWFNEDDSDEEENADPRYFFNLKTRTYLRDIDDNLTRVLDIVNTYKELCTSLDNTHATAQDHKLNATMYILAIVSTIFLPLTFAAGVYGMNFDIMPELHWHYGYVYWWGVVLTILVVTGVLLKIGRIL